MLTGSFLCHPGSWVGLQVAWFFSISLLLHACTCVPLPHDAFCPKWFSKKGLTNYASILDFPACLAVPQHLWTQAPLGTVVSYLFCTIGPELAAPLAIH